ncbi:MAG: DoxX family protein, partial [Xanthobacteraceae bacterium]
MKTRLIDRLVATEAAWSPLALRIPVGIIFMAHGGQKLFGWFGGYGLEGTGQWMASIGLAPGYLMALLAGSAEFFGGLALILGLLV